MGFLSALGKLFSGETVSWESSTHVNTAQNLLTDERRNYIGEWVGDNARLLIKPDGSVEYRRRETIGDTTNTTTVSGPINAFHDAGFTVGVLGNNTHFEVDGAPRDNLMIVNGERLQRVG